MSNRTIAIASGKGGVGKTFVTANLALSLSQQMGEKSGKVVAVDLDIGCGNLNTTLGVRTPNGTINDFLLNRVTALDAVLSPTGRKNLQLVSCSYSGLTDFTIDSKVKNRLIDAIRKLDASFTLMDLAAGTSPEVLDFFLAAEERIVVINPESLSLHNSFMFLKSAVLHYVNQQLRQREFLEPVREKVAEIAASNESLDIRALIEQLKVWDRIAGYMVSGMIDDLKLKFVINMYRGGREKAYLSRFHNLLTRYLYMRSNVEYLGFVHFGKKVRESVQSVKPFLVTNPNDRVSGDLKQLAAKLISNKGGGELKLQFPETSWSSLLRFVPGRTDNGRLSLTSSS